MIREAMKNGTDMGKKAKSFVEAGNLVPDEVVIGIIKERLSEKDCENGFILDGFPRTIPQAEALDRMGIEIDTVLSIEVADERIVNRMSGRRVCEKCGASYHLEYKKSKVEGVCDACGGNLVCRKDDALETVLAVPRVFLPLVLKGCVDWAKENNVELITAEHMQIINDKRSKEKNKK